MSMLEVLLWGFSVITAFELAAIVLFSNRSNGEQRTMSSADESIAMGPLPNVELHSSNNGEQRTMSSPSRSGRKKWIFKVFTCSSSSRDEKEKEKNHKTQKQKQFPKKLIAGKPANGVAVGKRANRAQEMKKKKKTSLLVGQALLGCLGLCFQRALSFKVKWLKFVWNSMEVCIIKIIVHTAQTAPMMLKPLVPHNSTGKVFTKDELETIDGACHTRDCLAIIDEVYEHITYDNETHISLASLSGMQRGWRIGWVVAHACIASAIRSIHTKLMDSVPAPFQEAALTALRSPLEYFESLRKDYESRRNYTIELFAGVGFQVQFKAQGSFFLFAKLPEN
ncbi:unnamed protein product [Camellia sinensis]